MSNPNIVLDVVNHPPHYTAHPVFSGECIDYTRHMDFITGNAFKYVWRYTGKNGTEDLNKAVWYLDRVEVARSLPKLMVERMFAELHRYRDNLPKLGISDNIDHDDVSHAGRALTAIAEGRPLDARAGVATYLLD